MAGQAPEAFAARFSIPKVICWAAGSGIMAAVCLPLTPGLLWGAGAFGFVIGVVALVGVLFFGGIAAVFTRRLFDRREQVVIDSQGLYVRSHGEQRIALRSIRGLHTDVGRLSVSLHKPSKYPIESRHRRFIYRINGSAARGFFGDVWIWTNQLDQPQAAFMGAMAAHRPQTTFERNLAETIAAD